MNLKRMMTLVVLFFAAASEMTIAACGSRGCSRSRNHRNSNNGKQVKQTSRNNKSNRRSNLAKRCLISGQCRRSNNRSNGNNRSNLRMQCMRNNRKNGTNSPRSSRNCRNGQCGARPSNNLSAQVQKKYSNNDNNTAQATCQNGVCSLSK